MLKSLHYGTLATTHDPLNPEFRYAVAFPWGQLGRIRARQGYKQEALVAHQREIDLQTLNVVAWPNHWQFRLLLSAAHIYCVESMFAFRDTSTAKPHIEASLRELRTIAAQRPDDMLIRTDIGWSLTSGVAVSDFTVEQRNSMWTELEGMADYLTLPGTGATLNKAAWFVCVRTIFRKWKGNLRYKAGTKMCCCRSRQLCVLENAWRCSIPLWQLSRVAAGP